MAERSVVIAVIKRAIRVIIVSAGLPHWPTAAFCTAGTCEESKQLQLSCAPHNMWSTSADRGSQNTDYML